MKICFAIGTLSYSGAEKIMYYLIKEMVKKHEVSLILLSVEKPYDFLEGVTQYAIYDKNEIKQNRVIRTLRRQHKIRSIIKENDFDIILSFGVIFNLDIVEACYGLPAKVVLCERNDPYHDPHSKILRFRRSISYHLADGLIFQTKTIQSFFSKGIQNKSIVIPNFIEERVPEYNRYKPQRKAFATSARLDNRQKDQLLLIRAFADFKKNHEDFTLELYGDGPDKKKLENEAIALGIEESVKFMGKVNNPMSLIRTAYAFVLTSVYEGMPNSLIEAMAHGMPVVSSDCSGGGAAFLIDDGKNGLLFPVGSQQKLHEAMELVADPKFAMTIGNEAYKVNDRLEYHKIVAQWEDFLIKIAN